MSENIIQIFTLQFSTNLDLKLQQQGSKLRGRVDEGFHVGRQASPVQQASAIGMSKPAGRFAPISRVDTTFTRRWVFPSDGELPQLIDTFDELKTTIDPKSKYLLNAAYATGRFWDDEIIAQAFATAYTGNAADQNALTSETWSTSYDIADTFGAGATSVGLTVAKFIEARRLFRHNHVDVDTDPLTMVVGSTQESDLLKQVQVVSTDFNDRPVLTDGKVTRFLGFDIVYSERLAQASSIRSCIAFARSGMYLGIWKDMTNNIDVRPDLSGRPWQLLTTTSCGATRTQPGKVLKVKCADTVGGDITV